MFFCSRLSARQKINVQLANQMCFVPLSIFYFIHLNWHPRQFPSRSFFFFLSHPNIKVIFYSYRKPPGLLLKCIYSNVFYWFAENKCHPADVKCLCQKQLAYANIGVSIRNGTKPSQMNDSVSHHVDL